MGCFKRLRPPMLFRVSGLDARCLRLVLCLDNERVSCSSSASKPESYISCAMLREEERANASHLDIREHSARPLITYRIIFFRRDSTSNRQDVSNSASVVDYATSNSTDLTAATKVVKLTTLRRCDHASAPTARQMPLPTFRRHSFPLQKARSAKLFLFLLFNSSLKQSQSKLPHREGPSRLFLLHHIQLWEKVPGHAMGFSRGTRKRAAIDASTPAAYSPALSSHNRRLSPLPSALRMCAVGSLAGLSLGRLACKGDEDMSPWPSTGGCLWGSSGPREEEAVGSSW